MTPTTRGVAIAALTLLVLAGVGAAAASSASGPSDADKMTVCHKPGDEDRTLRIDRNAWNAHRAHGDHAGACDADDADTGGTGEARAGATNTPAEPVASVRVRVQSHGEVDGEAVFLVVVSNEGDEARGVTLDAVLDGRGSWRIDPDVRPDGCTLERRALSCDLGTVAADGSVRVRLLHDAGPEACAEPSVDATVSADNDDDADDDHHEASARVGACALLPDHSRV